MTNFMVTRSGIEFDFDNSTKDMIRISDIAFSLSRQRRFNGHTLVNASVALHSVIVSHIVPRQYAIYGLLHNAHEAYTGDITTPVKRFCKPEITELECRIDKAIYERFGLSEPTQDVRDKVRHADLSHLLHEKIEYLPQSPTNWGDL